MLRKLMTIAALIGISVPCLADVKTPGLQKFQFQKCEIICIQDTKMSPPQKLFTDTVASGYQQSESTYEASVNVFLGRKEGKSFLVDAGNDQQRGSLREKLHKIGISADTITDIFITHIHPDHIGGLIWNDKPLFPNATIHIAQEEFDSWRKDKQRSALAKYLSPYSKKINKFEYNKPLPCGLIPLKRAGHTPGHTIFKMQLDEQNEAIFVGDIAHAAALQFPHPTFCAKYDASPSEAVQSRIITLQMKGILFGAHFPFPGTAQGAAIVNGEPNWSFSYNKHSY